MRICRYILFFVSISFLFPDELEEKNKKKKIINHDWKLNVFSIGYGMPNIGQFENNKPFKALSLMLMKYYWLNEYNCSKISENISDRNRSFWWLLFLNFYGIVDSYVDNQLKEFPDNDNLESELESK